MADEIAGWEGLVLPYGSNSPVGDQRVVYASKLSTPHRRLPLPVKVQWSSAHGHMDAEQGLAAITRVWSTPDGLMASGTIDTSDPRGAALARKIRDGFLGWVSADIETDGGRIFTGADGSRRHGYDVWRLIGVTLVSDPAFERARVWIVTDPKRINSADNTADRELVGAEFSATETISIGRVVQHVQSPTTEGSNEPMTDTTPDPENTDGFAVAAPGDVIIAEDGPDSDSDDGLSDRDVQRIATATADAVMSRLTEMEAAAATAAAEFAAAEEAEQRRRDMIRAALARTEWVA